MASFEILYDAEEDMLEISFETFDERFARTVNLNDNIILYTDLALATAWGLSFYSYRTLLQVNETNLDELALLSEVDTRRALRLLETQPASHFLEVLVPYEFRARVKSPTLTELIRSNEK